jgi:DNA-binding beta-propeller fold protein YncE
MRSALGGRGSRSCWSGWVVRSLAPWLSVLALFVLPATAGAAGTVYVVNGLSSISQYAIGQGGLLSPLAPAMVATAPYAVAIAVTPDGKSVYITNNSVPATVSEYNVDAETGALSPKNPATVPVGQGVPAGIAVTPDGKSAYVTNEAGGTISQFNIAPVTGVLSPKAPATVSASILPQRIAISPDGKSAYVTMATSVFTGIVGQYDINPVTGVLSPKTPSAVVTDAGPTAVVVSRDSRSVYVTNDVGNGGGTVTEYDAGAGGALTPKTPASIPIGFEPVALAITPDGKSAYVANELGNTIAQENIDPVTGVLSPKTPPTVATGSGPSGIVVTPDGTSAYVTIFNGGSLGYVSQYNINRATGTLSPKVPATVAAGTQPFDIAIGPLPRVPTSKDQCKNGGWRNYGTMFKNQGQCVTFVVKQARQKCLTERAKIGLLAFQDKYGLGRYHVRALRRCINQASR